MPVGVFWGQSCGFAQSSSGRNWTTRSLGIFKVCRLLPVTTCALPRDTTRSPPQCGQWGSDHRYECVNVRTLRTLTGYTRPVVPLVRFSFARAETFRTVSLRRFRNATDFETSHFAALPHFQCAGLTNTAQGVGCVVVSWYMTEGLERINGGRRVRRRCPDGASHPRTAAADGSSRAVKRLYGAFHECQSWGRRVK